MATNLYEVLGLDRNASPEQSTLCISSIPTLCEGSRRHCRQSAGHIDNGRFRLTPTDSHPMRLKQIKILRRKDFDW